MLGLFQSDIPIGRRLWTLFLILALVKVLSGGSISFSQEPVAFFTQVLLFYGFVLIASVALGFLPSMVTVFVTWIRVSREQDSFRPGLDDEEAYRASAKGRTIEGWAVGLNNVSFFIGVFLAIVAFNTDWMVIIGVLGIIYMLIVELVDVSDIFTKETTRLIELKKLEAIGNSEIANIRIRMLTTEEERYFSIYSDWLKEINFLLNNKWEIIELSSSDSNPVVILKKISYGLSISSDLTWG